MDASLQECIYDDFSISIILFIRFSSKLYGFDLYHSGVLMCVLLLTNTMEWRLFFY